MDTESIKQQLDRILQQPAVRAALDEHLAAAREKLAGSEHEWATVPVDLAIYGDALPDVLRSSRVSVFRAGSSGRIERHPNSAQFVCLLQGTLDIQTRTGDTWLSQRKRADSDQLADRWSSVEAGIWHRPVVGADGCEIVAFHTVPAGDLIDQLAER